MASAAVLISFSQQAAERWVGEQAAIKEREAQMAQTISKLRKSWQADSASGVVELALGRMKVWLAAPPLIDVEYENELGAGAHSEIPMRIVFLNDSFLPVTTESAPALTAINWSVEVQNAIGETLRTWYVEESLQRTLQPAERRDYQLTWDGPRC